MLVSNFQLSQQMAYTCKAILAELYRLSVSATLRFVKVPLNCSSTIQQVNLFPHSCASPQDFSREHTVFSSRLLRRIFNNISPRIDLWCTKLLTKHQLDINDLLIFFGKLS